jgi:regulator of sigma E protease
MVGSRVEEVGPNSPAATAGLQAGDTILAVDGERYAWGGLTGTATPVDSLRARAGETVVLGVLRANGSTEDLTVTLRPEAEITPQNGALGITRRDALLDETVSRSLPDAISLGARETGAALGLIVGGLGSIAGSFAAPTTPPPVQGPVGIATQIGDIFWNAGPIMTLYVAAILSANLAVVNVLPFPPLDGGRMLMITLKSIFGRRISLKAEQMTYMVGFVFLFAFLIWITGFDVLRELGVVPMPTTAPTPAPTP